MADQESYPLNTGAEGNGEKSTPIIPCSPNYQPQNSFTGYNIQYPQGMAALSIFSPVRTLYRNGYHLGNDLYHQDSAVPLQHEYGHSSMPQSFQRQNRPYTDTLPNYQGAKTPQHNEFSRGNSPLNPFASGAQANILNSGRESRMSNPAPQDNMNYNNSVPQLCSVPQIYPKYNNGFRSPVADNARPQRIPQFNSPLNLTTKITSNDSGGSCTPSSDQVTSTLPVDDTSGQKLKQPQVLHTPQCETDSPPLSRSTPAGMSNGSGNLNPEKDGTDIKRKPAMVPKKYPLRPEHLMPGCIVWLSSYLDGHEPILCVQNHECNDKVKEKDGRNHPVMILRINQRRGSNIIGDVILDITLMTTLCGLPLDKYVQKLRTLGPDPSKQWYLQETMPMSWAPPVTPQLKGPEHEALKKREQDLESQHHAELNQRGNTLLFLSRGSMQRRSYMRVHHIYAVPIKQLQACSRYAKLAHMVRLDECGYWRVMEALKLVPEPWESSIDRSVAFAPQRLRNLRDKEMAQFNAIELAESQSRQDKAVMQQDLNVAQQSPLGNASGVEAESRESC